MTPEKITLADGALRVPEEPIIPFIEGDGTGVDIWPASKLVFDAAASKHGKTIYEADAMIDGKNYEILVSEDGKLISKKLDNEENEKGKKEDDEKKKG